MLSKEINLGYNDSEISLSIRERGRHVPSTPLRTGLREVEGVRVGIFV
ncbi:MAG: hypothetical protein AABY41_08875 [Nitrospirota bacterium]